MKRVEVFKSTPVKRYLELEIFIFMFENEELELVDISLAIAPDSEGTMHYSAIGVFEERRG